MTIENKRHRKGSLDWYKQELETTRRIATEVHDDMHERLNTLRDLNSRLSRENAELTDKLEAVSKDLHVQTARAKHVSNQNTTLEVKVRTLKEVVCMMSGHVGHL